MQFIALFVIIVCLIAIAYRDLRLGLLSLAAILLAAMAFYFLSPDENLTARKGDILSEIELSRTEVRPGYARGFVLDLRVNNHNRERTLNHITVRSRLSDCTPDQSQCLVIGEESNVLKLRLPPGQARDAQINLRIKQINPLQGIAVWNHEVIGVR